MTASVAPAPGSRSPSLALRAILAVALMIGFYVLALAIAGALLAVPWAEVEYGHRLDGRIAVFCIGGAGAILLGVMPRRDRFTAPGPRLTESDQPELFATLRATADAAGETMPREVYLVPDMNAWVAQRGGVMGFGSRRVMGLGLPLMERLSVDEMRAVLAHEFGHYQGGDTALGPWIYRTRDAIMRTLRRVAERSGIIAKPFLWYGKAFLRITHAISRRQEYAADALAARIVGAPTLASALHRLHRDGAAFDSYWNTELAPALGRGYRPPFAAGFSQFVEAPNIARQASEMLEREMKEGKPDPYDTHPALRDRLAALGTADMTTRDDAARAVTLLRDVPSLERTLIDAMVRPDLRDTFKPMTWDDAGEMVWLPQWRELAQQRLAQLEGLMPQTVARFANRETELAYMMGFAPSTSAASAEHVHLARQTTAAAIAVALHARGFRVHALPGMPVELTRDGLTLRPFDILDDVKKGTIDADGWAAACQAAEISSTDLATAVRTSVANK